MTGFTQTPSGSAMPMPECRHDFEDIKRSSPDRHGIVTIKMECRRCGAIETDEKDVS